MLLLVRHGSGFFSGSGICSGDDGCSDGDGGNSNLKGDKGSQK